MASFLVGQMGQIAEANRDPAMMPAALTSSGGVLTVASLSFIFFKTPGGILLLLHGSAPAYLYYGILVAVMIYGLTEAFFGYWVVPRDPVGWHATGKTLLWFSVLLLVVVACLEGLTLLK